MQAKTAPARPSRGRIVRPNNWGVFLGREQGDLSFSASFEKLTRVALIGAARRVCHGLLVDRAEAGNDSALGTSARPRPRYVARPTQ